MSAWLGNLSSSSGPINVGLKDFSGSDGPMSAGGLGNLSGSVGPMRAWLGDLSVSSGPISVELGDLIGSMIAIRC